jgi:uncharacterized damage-inducible protein DinB
MTELERIAAELQRMYSGDAWHGPSLREALLGIRETDAEARALRETHTIFELVHHIAAWTSEVRRRLEGAEPSLPVEGDWPDPETEISESVWQDTRTWLDRAHEELIASVLAFDPARLDEPVGKVRDAAAGTGVSYYAMLHGLVQHDAYHSGQILLIRKALGR